jgi:hypothetical protein
MGIVHEQAAALEEELKRLRAKYTEAMRTLLTLREMRPEERRRAFEAMHAAAVEYFNAHERAIPVESRLNLDLNVTVYTERAETSANVLETIATHYLTVRRLAGDCDVDVESLQPSIAAFANMQRLVGTTQPDIARDLRERFVKLGLPIRGFDYGESRSTRPPLTGARVTGSAQMINNYTACAIGPNSVVGPSTITSLNTGSQQMGDKTHIGGDVTNSAVGSSARLKARDIVANIHKTGLDDDTKQIFAQAAQLLANLELEEGDRSDASDDLGKLASELDKPTRDEGRIQKIWARIQSVAPTVASILASAVSIGKLTGKIQ